MTALNVEPRGYLRKILAHDEKVLAGSREHFLFLVARLFWWLVLAAAIIVAVAAVQFGPGEGDGSISALYALAAIPLAMVFWRYWDWENHGYVITNRRVIQMTGVVSKQVVDSLLEKLNDVKTTQTFFGRVFNYGDIEILTANEFGANRFRHIADPIAFKRIMLDAKSDLERGL